MPHLAFLICTKCVGYKFPTPCCLMWLSCRCLSRNTLKCGTGRINVMRSRRWDMCVSRRGGGQKAFQTFDQRGVIRWCLIWATVRTVWASVCEIWSITSPLFPTNVLIRLVYPAGQQSPATRCFTVAPDTCACITWQLAVCFLILKSRCDNIKIQCFLFFCLCLDLVYFMKLYTQQSPWLKGCNTPLRRW